MCDVDLVHQSHISDGVSVIAELVEVLGEGERPRSASTPWYALPLDGSWIGIENVSTSVRQAGNMRCLLVIGRKRRSSVSPPDLTQPVAPDEKARLAGFAPVGLHPVQTVVPVARRRGVGRWVSGAADDPYR